MVEPLEQSRALPLALHFWVKEQDSKGVNMVRVGIGKPKIWFYRTYNDMGHVYPAYFDCVDWFWMDLNDFMAKTEFEAFNMKPNLPKEEKNKLLEKVLFKREKIDHLDALLSASYAWAYELQCLLDRSKSQIWEFNAVNKNLDGYIREVAFLGDKRLTKWSWFDAYIKFVIFNLTCRILNKMQIPKLIEFRKRNKICIN